MHQFDRSIQIVINSSVIYDRFNIILLIILNFRWILDEFKKDQI